MLPGPTEEKRAVEVARLRMNGAVRPFPPGWMLEGFSGSRYSTRYFAQIAKTRYGSVKVASLATLAGFQSAEIGEKSCKIMYAVVTFSLGRV